MSTQANGPMPHHSPPLAAASSPGDVALPGCVFLAPFAANSARPAALRIRPNDAPRRLKSFLEKTLTRANPPHFLPAVAALIHSFISAAGCPSGGFR